MYGLVIMSQEFLQQRFQVLALLGGRCAIDDHLDSARDVLVKPGLEALFLCQMEQVLEQVVLLHLQFKIGSLVRRLAHLRHV